MEKYRMKSSYRFGVTCDRVSTSKLNYLTMVLGKNVSSVLRLAIDALYEKHRDEKSDAWCGIRNGNQD